MIRRLRQTCFTPNTGDCFRTCVAMILDMDPAGMPNFCEVRGKGEWWRLFQGWLDERHMTAVEVNLTVDESKAPMMWVTMGVPCILSGKSPRGNWLHSVVGEARGPDGWAYLHDPHPDGGFLDGEPWYVLFFAPLRPDLAVKR
jgi:hypothetical protein